ncbi:hydroxyacylglutathione hydrolase [Rhodobaculum claviforme]|uniref:Hydroxyacylglutathione hydrolase n=1 Tax=Rhodobaculum claviforme TaxID=1549854 RepID=A0A934WK21_9RHOB|nr:hydroxyacylglutathione hydrolase [Rhodobaculum claviforme]MBK5928424.1 hydroxyacylglutathione hydrolase [Rhodobaculum claviforme]
MPLQVVTVPCRTDNFAFLAHDPATGATAVVDVPEAAPILAALADRGWRATDVLLTHHHPDHVEGLAALLAGLEAPVTVTGAAADAHRLPPLDRAVAPGDSVAVGAARGTVLDVSGHTVGHVAFVFDGAAFTGDSLMALGCGRLFEGDAAMMWDSLSRLRALPGDTRILSGHDYLDGNLAFAQSVEPGNTAAAERVARARSTGAEAVHVTLEEERATNPFLRPEALASALGMDGRPAAEVFAELRRRKDRF